MRDVDVDTIVLSAIPLVLELTATTFADVTTLRVASPRTELPDTRSPVPVAIIVLVPAPVTVADVVRFADVIQLFVRQHLQYYHLKQQEK